MWTLALRVSEPRKFVILSLRRTSNHLCALRPNRGSAALRFIKDARR